MEQPENNKVMEGNNNSSSESMSPRERTMSESINEEKLNEGILAEEYKDTEIEIDGETMELKDMVKFLSILAPTPADE
jgi:hypothetical protein